MRRIVAPLLFVIALTAAGDACAAIVYAAVSINGNSTGLIVSFDQEGDDFLALPEDLRKLGLIVPDTAKSRPDGHIELRSLAGVRYVFRAGTQTLAIEADEKALTPNLVGKYPENGDTDAAAYGALLNYGAAFAAATKSAAQFSGNLEFRLFGPPGIFESTWYGGPVGGEQGTSFRRLDTALIHDDTQSLTTWTAGDFISNSQSWSTPVRGVGFSLARDFDIRPDLITQPMPWLQGNAAVPSTVDLFLNDVHELSEAVPPGPFTVTQLPLVNGEGQIALAVTDALGRQTVQNFSFYATDQLLARGLMSYAVEGGWLRQDYATADDRYTLPFAQALVRRGINDWLTLEGRVAATTDTLETGAGLVAKLGEFAVTSVSLNNSTLDGNDGRQLRASIERQAGPYYLLVAGEQGFGNFRDVASFAGEVPVEHSLQIGAGWNSARFGTFGANYYLQRSRQEGLAARQGDIAILAGSWSYAIAKGWTAYASAYRSVDGSGSSGFMIGLTVSPAERLVVDAGVSGSGHSAGAFADASQTPPSDGGWGWYAQAQSAPVTSAQASAHYVSRIGEVGAGVSTASGGTVGSAYATGSVVWLAGGNPRLARLSSQSFAEVDTGEPGVGVTLENRDMGKTGSDGRLFVPDLVSFTPNHFAIEPDTVPLAVDIVTSAAIVRPPRNAGVLVKLQVRRSRSAVVRFVLASGDAVPLNAQVTLNGQPQGIVGYDGVAWLTGLSVENTVSIVMDDGACEAQFHVGDLLPGTQLGPVTCVAVTTLRPVTSSPQ